MTEVKPTIVVVGAAGGIGREVVKQLLPDNRVIALVLNQDQADEVTSLGASQTFHCDISDEQATAGALEQMNRQLPENGIAALIYCAAIQPVSAIELTERKSLEALFATNVFGTVQIIQGLIPSLHKAAGRIVLFSSLLGRITTPIVGGYSSTKFALEALANALRMELNHMHISVSLIEPGGVKTPMASAQPKLVEDALDKLSESERARYSKLYYGFGQNTQKYLASASSPEKIARVAVVAATGRKKPKPRYLVGSDAKFAVTLARLLPTTWADKFFLKLFT